MKVKNRVSSRTGKGPAVRRWPGGNASGQSLLEFALLTPVLLLLLLGVIEIGRYAYYAILVGDAAHAGAAYGAQTRFAAANSSGITAAACTDFSGQDTCVLTVSPNYLCQCDSGGTIGSSIDCSTGTCPAGAVPGKIESLQVTATGTFGSLFNYPGLPQSLTISKTATLRIESE